MTKSFEVENNVIIGLVFLKLEFTDFIFPWYPYYFKKEIFQNEVGKVMSLYGGFIGPTISFSNSRFI